MKKMLCFDLDGTLVDFYNFPNWLPLIRAENPAPYAQAEPLWDMDKLAEVLREKQAQGWEIRIITWLSMNSSEPFKTTTRQAKREWLNRYNFPYDHFHGVAYGATKADSVRKVADRAILFDDNQKVRSGWHIGETVDPTDTDIIDFIRNLT